MLVWTYSAAAAPPPGRGSGLRKLRAGLRLCTRTYLGTQRGDGNRNAISFFIVPFWGWILCIGRSLHVRRAQKFILK